MFKIEFQSNGIVNVNELLFTWNINDNEEIIISKHDEAVYTCVKLNYGNSFYRLRDQDNNDFKMYLMLAPNSFKYGY